MSRFDFDELRVEATTGDVMPRRSTANGSGDAALTWLFLGLALLAAFIGLAGQIKF
jgi:hypothetical protein